MITYCYETDDGRLVDRPFPMGKAPQWVLLDGDRAWRIYGLPDNQKHRRHKTHTWPMVSVMGGVHPSQVRASNAKLKRLGAPGHYDPKTGDLHIETRRDYCEHHRLTGKINLDAGYGDWAGGGSDVRESIEDRLRWHSKKAR